MKNTSIANNVSNVNIATLTTTSPLITDTVATCYFVEINTSYLKYVEFIDPPISLLCPRGAFIKSTHTIEFNFDDFPPHQRVYIFPSLSSESLLSIRQLRDFGCNNISH